MCKHYLLVAAVLLSWPAVAVAEPVKIDGPAIEKALSGQSVTGNQDGRGWSQDFRADGSTVYREANRDASPGYWRVQGDQYCSKWPPSDSWDCYDMAMEGGEILFIPDRGDVWRARIVAK